MSTGFITAKSFIFRTHLSPMDENSIISSQGNPAFFQKILEQSNDMISVSDLHGHFLYVTPSLSSQLGRPAAALYRMSLFDQFYLQDGHDVQPFFTGSGVNLGCSHDLNLAYKDEAGKVFGLKATLTNLLGDDTLKSIVIHYHEALEIKAEDFFANEANLKAVLESSNDGFIITDRNLKIQSFNRIAQKQVAIHKGGRILAECADIFDYVRPQDQEKFQEVFARVLQGEDVNADWTYHTEDGEMWTQYCIYPVKDGEEIIGTCIVGRDVTEAKKAENKLRLSEERYRTLIREGSDLTNIIDFEGNYVMITAALKSVLDPRYVGKNAFELVHPDDKEQLRRDFEKLKHTRRVKSAPYRFRVNENEYFWLETVGTNLMDDPAIQGIVINSHDVTDTVNHIKEIEHRNELLEEIAWVQSHLVRAPLARILGIIEILKNSKKDLEELLPHLENSAVELDQVIMDITQKSRELGDK